MTGLFAVVAAAEIPEYLESQFDIPDGFHVYRVATEDLTGGSYDITFDGQGRLLVGDGKNVRRLYDDDGDEVYDRFEIIASGLGGRGPQGLLVYGDRMYAVGGDGVQLFEGYEGGGKLVHKGRIGEPFHTGGDHSAHTVLRGHDGHLFFVTGDGGGVEDKLHITESTSPALFERSASVFRFSPDGSQWECVSTGGRNPPNLGMNYLGDLFSWDSDMEWHVNLPFYRPLRLNHWVRGGDQGWQGVGAYPEYYMDTLGPVLKTGRGSPTWGTFYEGAQFPDKYRNSYLVCDYLWKSASSGRYNIVGRLVSFHLERQGAGWEAEMQVFARPVKGAADQAGKPINFGLVDVDVAPDGSIFLSDHNQGIWRIFYDPNHSDSEAPPTINPEWQPSGNSTRELMNQLLSLDQPGAEWSRLREKSIREKMGSESDRLLGRIAMGSRSSHESRLRAIRLLAPNFKKLDDGFVTSLSRDDNPEIRAQGAWLLGLKSESSSMGNLVLLLSDEDALVRRRAAEGLTRYTNPQAAQALVDALNDPDRMVRYVAMNALSHLEAETFLDAEIEVESVQARMRILMATHLRRENPSNELLFSTLSGLISESALSSENHLDLLRILGVHRENIQSDEGLNQTVSQFIVQGFPDDNKSIRWEQIRLIGQFQIGEGFALLMDQLPSEPDPVTQFHLAEALSRLEDGWTDESAERLRVWFVNHQTGWFADFHGKGRQFPDFWGTVLNDYLGKHLDRVLAQLSEIDFNSQFGGILFDWLDYSAETGSRLIVEYRNRKDARTKRKLLTVLQDIGNPDTAAFLRGILEKSTDEEIRNIALRSLARMPVEESTRLLLAEGIRNPDLETAVVCARALSSYGVVIDRELADLLFTKQAQRPDATKPISFALRSLVKIKHPNYLSKSRNWNRDDIERAMTYWNQWFLDEYGIAFVGSGGSQMRQKSDDDLLAFFLEDRIAGGDFEEGRDVYHKVRCAECHGGEETIGMNARLFGPELTGVTRRLNRTELAEAIITPSKKIEDRFKGQEVILKNGLSYTGFVTAENEKELTFSTQERIVRILKAEIESQSAQSISIMPEGLLNSLSWNEIRDLLAFLGGLHPEGEE